jgi:alkylhydroperoxidase family enzyme
MDMKTKPSARIAPLPPETTPDLKDAFAQYVKALGFIPNSMLILQRKPKIVKAMAQLTAAVWEPDGEVGRDFKRLVAHVASRTAGCQYCMAHTAGGALLFGVDPKKVEAVWDFRTSPLYSEAERVALDFAIAAASL